MPSNHFDSLLAELDAFAKEPRISDADRRELTKRRSADSQILKAMQDAGRIIREQHDIKGWMRDLQVRSAARAQTKQKTLDNERHRLAKAIEQGTAMLKSAVADGSLSSLDAARGEAIIHQLNQRLGALS